MLNPSDVTNLGVVLQYTSEFKDTGEVLKFLNAVDDLTSNLQFNKYFKDTGTLIDSLTRKTQEYAQALKNGDGSAKTLAQDVVKTANALEGISGKSLRDVLPQFEQLEKHITRAVSEVPEINKAFRPEQFANIKSSVDMLNAARQGLGDEFIKRLSATSNIGALKRQIEELSVSLQNAEEKVRELSQSQGVENLERLQSQLRAVRSELESARMMQANEFYSFLSTHQISQHEWEASSLIDDIMVGAKTYNDAVTELRHMLPERFGGEIQQSSIDALIAKVDTLDAKIAALGNTETAVMTDMARSLAANPVFNADQQAGFAGLSVSGLGDISKLFGVLIENSGAATGGLDGVVGSLTSLLGALQSLGSVDTEKLQAIAGALGAMSHMDKLQISSAAVKNFGEALNKMDAVNDTPKLITLSRLDWTGWQNLKVSKASLNNLSEYLPAISKGVDIGVLERLAALPSEALNANMAALAGRNIKVQFDTAMGGESDALAESTRRFAAHTDQVNKAVEAEKAKEDQAGKLTEALNRESTALTRVEAGKPTTTNAILGGLHQPEGSTERDIQELAYGLGRVGVADADIVKIIQSMDGFDASVARVKTQVNETTGELISMEITAKNAAKTATTVWQGAFHKKEDQWVWRNSTSYDLAKEQSQAAKEEAAEQKRIAAEMAAMWADYERERQDQIRSETNISYQEYAQQAKEIEASTRLQIEAYNAIEDAKQSAQKGIEADNAAAAKEEAAEQKRIAADTAEAYRVVAAEREKEAEARRAQIQVDEQLTKRSEQQAREEADIAKRTAREIAQYDAAREKEYKEYVDRLEAIHRREVRLRNQTQAEAKNIWQEAFTAVNESKASLQFRVNTDALDDVRRKIAEIFGDMRNFSGAAVKDGTLQFTDEQIQSLNILIPLLQRYSDVRAKLKVDSDDVARQDRFANSVSTMNNKIASTYERYRQAIERSTTARLRFNAIQRAAAQIADGDRAGIAKVVAQLKNLEADLINSGKTVDTWWQKLAGGFSGKLFYGVLARSAMYVRRVFVNLYKNVQEINTAMTQLQIVTGSTANDMATYLDKAAKSAQRLGVNMKDLIDSTTTFARLGYTAEESSLLAEYTAMLTKVGDIDTSAATDAVTAMVKAFGIDMEDVRTVMDEMVVVGNNFPISVAQIAEGMNNASSSLAAAGNTIEQAMALLTAANTTVQNISKSSTGLRTIAARLRKTVVSDDGEEEAMSESDYNDIVKALTKHRVALTDINGEYRSTYDIIQDIAAVWDEMSSMDQAALAEKLAGTKQQNIFHSLVGQFKEAQGAVEATTDAGGEMERAYGVYLDSIEGKLGRVKATFQTLSTDVLNSSTVGTVLDIANGGLKIADVLAKINTLLPLTITLVGTIKSVQHVVKAGTFATTLQQLTDMNTVLGRQSGGLTKVSAAWKSLGGFAKAGIVIGGITTAISTVIGLVQQASEARRRAAEEAYQSFTQESQVIDDYKVKIAELKTQLDQGNLSEEQAYEVRKELLGIQQDMIDQLGAEAGAFDILHDSITNVNSALDGYRAGIATKNLNDNAKYYNEALEFANQMLGESEDTLYRIELAGGNLQEIRDIYDNIFGSNLLDNALGLAFIPKDTRQNALRQIQEAYDMVYALDADGLKGQYKDVLLALSAGTEQLRSVSQWQQWWTTLTNYDGVEKAIQEFVTQTIAADVQLTQLYRQLSGSETQFADAVVDKDDALAQSIYDEISGLNFDDISNDQVRQYFEDLQSKFAAFADTYILDINLRTNLQTPNAKSSIRQALHALEYQTEDELRAAMNAAAEEYNRLTNGNLDYRNRPVVTAEQMRAAGWTDFPIGEYATTYDSGYTIGNANIIVTPILDNGEILSPKALDAYVDSLDPDDVLGSDSKHLVINVSTDPDFDWEGFNDSIRGAKENHLNSYLQLAGEGNVGIATWLKNANLDDTNLTEAQRTALQRLRDIAEANDITFDHLIDTLVELGYIEQKAATTTKDLAEALTITELDTTRGVVKSFHDAWTTMTEDGEIAFDKLKGIFSSLTDKDGNELVEGLDGYISRLAELRDDVPATEAVLNELFTAYVAGQIDAENLAESDLHVVEAMLKEAGVANAAEVALDMLVTAKLKAADANGTLYDASGNLSTVLLNEIQALMGDGNAAEYATIKLAELELQKIILSSNPLNMTSSIGALGALAGQSTTTAAALAGLFAAVEKVQSINSRIESLQSQLAPDITQDYFAEAERIGRVMDEISALRGQQTSFSNIILAEAKRAQQELASTLPTSTIAWTPPTTTGTTGTDSTGTEKTFAEQLKERYDAENQALEAQLELLKHQYDEYVRLGRTDKANQNLKDQAAIYDQIMLNAHNAAEELRNYYLSLGLTLDEINKQADVLEYSNAWWDAYEAKLALGKQLLDDLSASLDEVTSELDNFQNVYKTFIQVAEQYHTDGFLSVDSLKEILSYGPEYLQFLSDEGGQLTYNEQALQKIIAAKTEEMAVTTATVYLEKVLAAIRDGDVSTLKKLADMTNSVSAANWGVVDSLLGQIEVMRDEGKISQKYYSNIEQNIKRLKTLTVSATTSIKSYGDSLHSAYQSQKDAMTTLFDLTKELVKWELDQQVEALEKEKKAYDDLIDRKKELLDTTKKEADHEKAVAKQVKAIADLQKRIALLSLDDSLEARAEQAQLEKELAEKQESLNDSQADYYLEQTKTALDNDKKRFDERKDADIAALEKTLSSAEKLDKATRERISKAWREDWAGFYADLKLWNEEYGTHLSNEVAKALSGASDAIALWGDPINALKQVNNDEIISDIRGSMRANALAWWTASNDDQVDLARNNRQFANQFLELTGTALSNVDGTWRTQDGKAFFELGKDEIEGSIIAAMQQNSADWWTTPEEERDLLVEANVDLAARLARLLGSSITKRDGVWYRADGTKLYAEGGVADYTGTAIVHGGKAAELVLNNADVAKVYNLIHNTPSLVGTMVSNMMGSLRNIGLLNNSGGGSSWTGDINITINHDGGMSDADARRYGQTIADTALDRLRDTFSRRGVHAIGHATLKA